ncbi:hypothetical protein TWF706_010110 [Orbilia oligospora]|nr:hypothetical protein TWF706_010110 [Orbilia oligospora]
MPPSMSEAETVKFLLLCLDKCDTKSMNWEQIAEASGLNGQKAAYKKLWDLKTRLKKNIDGETLAPPTKVKKARSTKTSPRKKRKVDYSEDRDEEEIPLALEAQVQGL